MVRALHIRKDSNGWVEWRMLGIENVGNEIAILFGGRNVVEGYISEC